MIVLVLSVYVLMFIRNWWVYGEFALIILIILLPNAHWLFFLVYEPSVSGAGSIAWFNTANFQAFLTQALEPLNVWGTNILLYGFWGERYASHYVNVIFLSSLWYVAG